MAKKANKEIVVGKKTFEYLGGSSRRYRDKETGKEYSYRQFQQKFGKVAQQGYRTIEERGKTRKELAIPKGFKENVFGGYSYFTGKFKSQDELKEFIRSLPKKVFAIVKVLVLFWNYPINEEQEENQRKGKGIKHYSSLSTFSRPNDLIKKDFELITDNRFENVNEWEFVRYEVTYTFERK